MSRRKERKPKPAQKYVKWTTQIVDQPLDEDTKRQVLEIWPNADLSIVKANIYFDGWTDYNDAAGLWIFRGIDDTIQYDRWALSGYSKSNYHNFNPRDIPRESQALEYIDEMEEEIWNNQDCGGY